MIYAIHSNQKDMVSIDDDLDYTVDLRVARTRFVRATRFLCY